MILVTGYFYRNNIGDDMFVEIWKHVLSKLNVNEVVEYRCIDDVFVFGEKSDLDLNEFDLIIFGGGDVLNSYFLNNVNVHISKTKLHKPMYAFSVGMPYPIMTDELKNFNFFTSRSMTDSLNLKRRFGKKHVQYFPDLSVYMPQIYSQPSQLGTHDAPLLEARKNNVWVFLTRSIFSGNHCYQKLIQDISATFDSIVTKYNVELTLAPFNTCENKSQHNEDDRLINEDISLTMQRPVTTVSRLSVKEMWDKFAEIDFCINMRYHAHMFSILTETPFVSMHVTKKVSDLLNDSNLSRWSYKLSVDDHDRPTFFDEDVFTSVFDDAWNNQELMKTKMRGYISTNARTDQFEARLSNLLTRVPPPKVSGQIFSVENVVHSLLSYLMTDFGVSIGDISNVTKDIVNNKTSFISVIGDVDENTRQNLSERLAALACFEIVQIPYPKYHPGMSQKILGAEFDVNANFRWVWLDNNIKSQDVIPRTTKPYFNAMVVNVDDFKGCHRSGWNHVVKHILSFHSVDSDLLFDDYIDRTFHWAHDIYRHTKIIPFQKKWCGFLHHACDTTYSEYNVSNLFQKKTFLSSLDTCVGLFTLSDALARDVRRLLNESGHPTVKIQSFVHPTEIPTIKFSFEAFSKNLLDETAKVIQIGAWLRDNYAIYRLETTLLKKAILRGNHMNNYFKPDGLVVKVGESAFAFGDAVTTTPPNKFELGILQTIQSQWKSVELINTLDDESYDRLLSENIVYLRLIDASAVNTVIECVVRNTPILINKLPAIIEMLGEEYPFYYSNATEASNKVDSLTLILQTHKYLSALPKERFTIEHFMRKFERWFTESSPSHSSASVISPISSTNAPACDSLCTAPRGCEGNFCDDHCCEIHLDPRHTDD
jgi:exopolysaccharide biosynthesis predicted pyruvyltransferase EpsI